MTQNIEEIRESWDLLYKVRIRLFENDWNTPGGDARAREFKAKLKEFLNDSTGSREHTDSTV